MFLIAATSRVLVIRPYFRLKKNMRKLEVWANGEIITHRFHKKYGKGAGKCMLKDCGCKS